MVHSVLVTVFNYFVAFISFAGLDLILPEFLNFAQGHRHRVFLKKRSKNVKYPNNNTHPLNSKGDKKPLQHKANIHDIRKCFLFPHYLSQYPSFSLLLHNLYHHFLFKHR